MAFIGDERNLLFAVGDIVCCHYKGYWKIIDIRRRYLTERELGPHSYYTRQGRQLGDELNPLLMIVNVANADLTKFPKRAAARQCDSAYCKRITEDAIYELIRKQADGYRQLIELIRASITR